MRFKLKNKMLAILPEIYESGIWKKYAGSIVEYAGKYGDISKTTVIKRLRLEENLKDKPCLKASIEKVGIHKVAMVAKITTPETDKAMAENLLNMSKIAVQSLSKELRSEKRGGEDVHTDAQLSFVDDEPSLCKAVALTKKMEMDEESTFLFLKLKAKLGKNMSDKEFLKSILEEREKQEFPDQKSITGDTFKVAKVIEPRYVRVQKKREVIAPKNGKCSYPNCNLPYAVLHHTDRYSESRNHDSIIPLCKVHHEFAHNNLIQNEKLSADRWELSVGQESGEKISLVVDPQRRADILYRKYRQKTLR
jgi:hypothetical protein